MLARVSLERRRRPSPHGIANPMSAAEVAPEAGAPGGAAHELPLGRRIGASGAGAPAGPAQRRGWVVIALLACSVSLLVVIAVFCMDVLSSARAYVGGESLWSKAQKDAVRELTRYAQSRDEAGWRRYQQSIEVPLGDRAAREELEKASPDLQVARQGFLEGGIHPDDIPGMIRLFRRFRHLEFLDRAIGIWAEGDRLIAELQQAAEELHARILSGSDVSALGLEVARIDDIDRRLTPLEMRFSDTLGEASRKTRSLLAVAVLAVGALLIACSALFVRRLARRVARYEGALHDANAQLEKRVSERTRELTQANARLLELDRLKSEFLATMSHELRTPLSGILGLAGLLQEGDSGPVNAGQKRRLGMIQSSGQHLLELIEDVLDVSRIEAGRMAPEAVSFEFADLMARIDAAARPLAQAKELALVCETRGAPLPVYADPDKCLRVLRCLVLNAVKFTEAGEVRITAGLDRGDLLVTVSDTGVGIAADQLPHIFEAFRQLDGSFRRAHGGAGLGLYLSRKLVELMGGTIGVESAPSAGSCFSVRLPQRPGR
jgi:signal transduction histidine kinase